MGTAANIIIGAAEVTVNGTNVGFTMGGSEVRYEPEFVEIMADQAVGVVRKGRSLERMYVKTTLLEVSLSQLRIAFMFPAANLSGSTLTLGYNGSCWMDDVAITLVGPGPSCGTRTFTFPKCNSMGNKTYSMKRDEAVQFETEFEILKDTNGHFGSISDT